MHRLAPNPYLIQFSVEHLNLFPASMCHAMAYLALSHRTQRLFQRADCSQILEMRSRFYHHQGLAIRALSEEIGNAKTKCCDLVIASVLMLLFTEVSSFGLYLLKSVVKIRNRLDSHCLWNGGSISLVPPNSLSFGAV